MSLLLSSLGSIAGCVRPEPGGYAAVVDGLPGGPPLAHWRLNEAGGMQMIDRKGGHHGTYVGTVQFGAAGLPQDSDEAVNFAGSGHGEIADDPGLHLSAFTLCLWFRLNTLLEGVLYPIFSKEQGGQNAGDFQIWADETGELVIQFQDGSANNRITAGVLSETIYHLVVRADSTGFDAYLNGAYLGKIATYTGAWSANPNDILLAASQTVAHLADVRIDEVALYRRALTEAEVLELSQRTEAPIAANDSFVAPENQTTIIDVVRNDIYVGQKANLTLQILSQPAFGTATVRGDNDVDFEAASVDGEQADSFTYRITDQNGTSNVATVDLIVQDTASQGGGTLVYDWQAQTSFINGISLANRSGNSAIGSIEPWVTGANLGGSLVKAVGNDGANLSNVGWNYAPDGSPALELHWGPGVGGVARWFIRLWDPFTRETAGPGHVRCVMEIKTCKSSDPTTHKANGHGPSGGLYPDFIESYQNSQAHVKYFCHLGLGNPFGGPINNNWWGNSSLPLNKARQMCQCGAGSSLIELYLGNFDRPGAGGGSNPGPRGTARLTDPGVNGYWHRLEIEIKLATPSTVPNNARRSEPEIEPSRTGDGFAKLYLTKDIDGELGTPGTRQLIHQKPDGGPGLIYSPRFDDVGSDDNLHLTNNITGPEPVLSFGGSDQSQAAGWAWIRRIQVYRYD